MKTEVFRSIGRRVLSKSLATLIVISAMASLAAVETKADELPPLQLQPTSLVSSITINTATEQVIAFDYNNLPIIVFSCSTGKKGNTTPGSYKTTNYYDWHLMNGGVWSRYAVRFNKGELMHSVPYYHKTPNSLEYKEYNKLGTPASAGCCRLALSDAKWIYENTVPNTPVNVINDPNIVFNLTRPNIVIDVNDKDKRGWDPTDTDPMSPYNVFLYPSLYPSVYQ